MQRLYGAKGISGYDVPNRIDLIGFGLPVLLIITWYLVTSGGEVPEYLIPSPIKISKVALDFAVGNWHLTPYSGTLIDHALASIMRVLGGFSLAVIIGLSLGFLTGRIFIIKRIIDPMIHLVRTIPGIGWLPVALVWFGVGEKTTIFLITLAAFFPIYVNAAQGIKSVSPLLLRAGRMLGANKFALITTVILPSAFPSIIAGLRLGLGISWAYLVLGELTGVTKGLGAVMMDARMLGHVDMVMVSMICIALLGWLSDRILIALFRSCQPRMGGLYD